MIFLVIFFEISANENTLLVLAAMLNLGSLKLDYDLILSSAFIQLHDWVTYMTYIISLYSSSPQPPSTNASSFIINSFSTYKFIIKIMLLFLRNQLTWGWWNFMHLKNTKEDIMLCWSKTSIIQEYRYGSCLFLTFETDQFLFLAMRDFLILH